ncbi:hypothetical protein GQ43DRAFT_488836 [Delitschia confertaspora ATCC 74209]|uniref:Vacuolar import and degradation protein-domain-containing protein n=1 Tax=Delitschia confertaspora ATCC 74209 TaxID=1513339 RepID=A0A9P4MV30_9PLEO|nr:hypothetical protein GQ43DRAFT_488836 [Delitschia confertaspora ATCC 74209]
MPPANSRVTSPPADPAQRPDTPPSYLSALRELESPVNSDILNLADTLTTQAEDDDYNPDPDPSLQYLRQAIDPQDEWRIQSARERLRREYVERATGPEDRERSERLRRVMNRLSRIHGTLDPPAYSDRVPSQNTLYDWSPASEADDEEELDQILSELRQAQPAMHPETLRALGRAQLDAERESRMRAYSSRLMNPSAQPSQQLTLSQAADGSLRSTAILQSVRRHPRFSARTRDYFQRTTSSSGPVHRSTAHTSEVPPPSTRLNPSRTLSPSYHNRREIPSQAAFQRYSERVSASERNSQRIPPTRSLSTPGKVLEETIHYLAALRNCDPPARAWELAYDYGIPALLGHPHSNSDPSLGHTHPDLSLGNTHPDLILSVTDMPPVSKTSWLRSGAVLSGFQRAQNVITTISHSSVADSGPRRRLQRWEDGRSVEPRRPRLVRGELSEGYGGEGGGGGGGGGGGAAGEGGIGETVGVETVSRYEPSQSKWPVRVTIHEVNWEKMTLSATMEATDVPSRPNSTSLLNSPTPDDHPSEGGNTASITTFLTGEMLDFRRFSLLTEGYTSTAANDALYWGKLPPFEGMSDQEVSRGLVSRGWMEGLGREWVLMRWKERCFVGPLTSSSSSSSSRSFDKNSGGDAQMGGMEGGYFEGGAGNGNQGNAPVRDQEAEASHCGLTISGFYYVALKRSDGTLEGLYYDPQSAPYQCLKMESRRVGGGGAWGFR